VLRPVQTLFHSADYPDLIVGLESPDDAAVWRIDENRAIVMTTDFFTPVVDDPFDYGAIAAANSLSDVYAMGGKPFLALNIAALPTDVPAEILSEILRGGAEKAREAGVVIAGGHTVQDKEPKFGLVVLGFVDPARIITKSGMRPGDRLVLTKPLGFGMTTTAIKLGQAEEKDLIEVVGWMKTLNEKAGLLAQRFNLRGGTDVTGYSLLGHGLEAARASGAGLRLAFERIPFTSGARHYAELNIFPGGAMDNYGYFGSSVRFAPSIDERTKMMLFDPQTSGGLLLAVPAESAAAFLESAKDAGQPAWEIGEVVAGDGIEVV
jgi:selenide,water dikinase